MSGEMAARVLDQLYGTAWQFVFVLGVAYLAVKAVTKIWRPARTFIGWSETLNNIVATQNEINDVVKAELMPNGGGSLKDQVTQIHQTLCAECPLFGMSGVCPLAGGKLGAGGGL